MRGRDPQSVKELCPAFSPAEYPPGKVRENVNVLRLWLFVLDVDHVTEDRGRQLLALVRELGLAAVVYTTFQHATDPWRFRVVIPLSHPVLGSAWPGFWDRANALFDGACDRKCRDPSRMFFGPFVPAGTQAQNFTEIIEGETLDVDAVLEMPLAAAAAAIPAERTKKLPLSRLESFAKTLSRKSDDYVADLGQTLLKVCKGDVFADPGDRDTTIFKLASVIGERFPNHDTESVAELFAPSLAKMEQFPDCPTVDDVAYKLGRAQDAALAESAAAEDQLRELESKRIREAFKNGRSTPYTPEELAGFGDTTHRWVLQRGSSFYLFFNGGYTGPYSEKEVLNAAVRELAPAKSAGVELFRFNKEGKPVQKTVNELVQQYGTVADHVVLDMRAQKTLYFPESRTVVEACCPVRPITPRYHADVDTWLRLLVDDELKLLHKLKSWIAAVTLLEEPCVALFLVGPKGTGKSLLALGLSRIWTIDKPTPLDDVFGEFNDSLARCPLCLADEQLPKDYRGYSKTADLRYHVQAVVRPFKRKHIPNSTIHGAARTVVTSNNKDILATQENISNNDIDAICDRFLYIETSPDAAEFLELTDTEDWVDGDVIAEHALWLRDNYDWQRTGRFLIQPENEQVHRALSTGSGPRSAVCQWLCSYLLNPKLFHQDARSNMFVRVKSRKFLVNAQGISNCWGLYITNSNERCPSIAVLSKALTALCTGERRKHPDSTGQRAHYRVVHIETLIAWAEDHDFADRERILEALTRDSDEPVQIKRGLIHI